MLNRTEREWSTVAERSGGEVLGRGKSVAVEGTGRAEVQRTGSGRRQASLDKMVEASRFRLGVDFFVLWREVELCRDEWSHTRQTLAGPRVLVVFLLSPIFADNEMTSVCMRAQRDGRP